MSSFWSGDVGPVLVRTLRAKAESRTKREGGVSWPQYCPEIADDNMGQALGQSWPTKIRQGSKKTDIPRLSLKLEEA
jgi:hypothetical protein